MRVTTPTAQSFLPTSISYIPLSKLPKPPPNTFYTVQSRRKNPHLAVAGSSQDTGGLGHAMFSALKPDSSTDSNTTKVAQQPEKPKNNKVFSAFKPDPSTDSNTTKKGQQPEKPKPNKGEDLSGSDILRALQKASAKKAKAKKQQKKKESSELKRRTNTISNGKKLVDFDKVRPITIKSDWATRLADLEKRLHEFSAF